ncbi:hypothetical protein FGO68_gene778 [Halteria grandinella]|uniref:Uncharacterized protein n=1 Tax=Halteria grandinella TaxID=5974 RepID=A0A8J8T6U0_HALGN|nr:hypothetical protein FGO68_gene778 [Halteria grandinella]
MSQKTSNKGSGIVTPLILSKDQNQGGGYANSSRAQLSTQRGGQPTPIVGKFVSVTDQSIAFHKQKNKQDSGTGITQYDTNSGSPRIPKATQQSTFFSGSESKFRESSLYNKNFQFQLQKDHLLQVRQSQLKRKYEGFEPALPTDSLPQSTQIQPISSDSLNKASYREIFGNTKLSQKKSLQFVNFSMERYNPINNHDTHNHTVYSQFFDKRINYQSERPLFRDGKMLHNKLSDKYNPVAALRLSDSQRRMEVEENRRQIFLKRNSYIMKNIGDLRKLNRSVIEKSSLPSSDQQIELIKRNPGDPILTSQRKPFQVGNILNFFDNMQSRMSANQSPIQRAKTDLNHQNYEPHPQLYQRPVTQTERITFKALRKISQNRLDPVDEQPDQIDNLSEILDSLQPKRKLANTTYGSPFVRKAANESQAYLSKPIQEISIVRQSMPSKTPMQSIEEKVPLVMSEAAINKRLKNLEDYIQSKKRLKDREDAVSHASQVIDTLSKQNDTKSHTSYANPFLKQSLKLKNLDMVLGAANTIVHQNIEDSIGETQRTLRSPRVQQDTLRDYQQIIDGVQDINGRITARNQGGSIYTTKQRSPRYLGEYDEDQEEEGEKQEEDTQTVEPQAKKKSKAKKQKQK